MLKKLKFITNQINDASLVASTLQEGLKFSDIQQHSEGNQATDRRYKTANVSTNIVTKNSEDTLFDSIQI